MYFPFNVTRKLYGPWNLVQKWAYRIIIMILMFKSLGVTCERNTVLYIAKWFSYNSLPTHIYNKDIYTTVKFKMEVL